MPSTVDLPIIPPSLPSGYCWPADPQQFVNDAIGQAVVQFSITGLTGILRQNTTPTNTQRDNIWFNTDTGHVLFWNNPTGAWVAYHPVLPGSAERRIYVGDTASLVTYDGGSAGAVGDASGPMWTTDAAFAGRFPIGAGNLPDTSNGTVTIAVNGTGGHNELAVDKVNLPNETLSVLTDIIGNAGTTGGVGSPVVGQAYGSEPIAGNSAAVDATDTSGGLSGCYRTKGQTEALGLATKLNTINPFYGVLFIVRTARRFYTS